MLRTQVDIATGDGICDTVWQQVIPPVPSFFTLLRPYLAHFFPVFSRFLRVFTVSTRRFQRAPSRNPGPRNGGTRTKTRDLGPSFDTAEANQRINWQVVMPSFGRLTAQQQDLEGVFRTTHAGVLR